MSKQLTTIDFHGAKLVAVSGDRPENTLVAMKPIIEGMGLDWEGQRQKIERHPVLSSCTCVIKVQVPGDTQERDHTFLSLNRINFWLATIPPGRIKNESVRQSVIIYQTELADVAFNYFFGKVIASGAHLTAKEAGGIAKGVVNKALTPISAKLDELMQKIDGSLSVRPTGVAVTNSRTARGWLQHYGVVKRKRGMSQRVSSALKSLSFRMGYVISQTTEEGKLCFHEAVANAYFTVGTGRHLLPKAVKGQKEMGLETTPVPFSQTPA